MICCARSALASAVADKLESGSGVRRGSLVLLGDEWPKRSRRPSALPFTDGRTQCCDFPARHHGRQRRERRLVSQHHPGQQLLEQLPRRGDGEGPRRPTAAASAPPSSPTTSSGTDTRLGDGSAGNMEHWHQLHSMDRLPGQAAGAHPRRRAQSRRSTPPAATQSRSAPATQTYAATSRTPSHWSYGPRPAATSTGRTPGCNAATATSTKPPSTSNKSRDCSTDHQRAVQSDANAHDSR